MKASITNPSVALNPSEDLIEHIKNLQNYDDMPQAMCTIRSQKFKASKSVRWDNNLLTNDDRDFLKSLNLEPGELSDSCDFAPVKTEILNLEDLLWLFEKLQQENKKNSRKVYLHELLLGSDVILPKNEEIPRNKELEARCRFLKVQQENREYKAITKNVDNVRKPHPEDTISYQIKQINKQLIAVLQFIITVLAGFLFGFQGLQLIFGTLDFGFRLLLGVICSLIIALAELYFLAKTLNEDLQYQAHIDSKKGHSKIN